MSRLHKDHNEAGNMKPVTLNALKQELSLLPGEELIRLCLRLAKFKKENKELLDYLLFDSNFEPDFIGKVKKEIDRLYGDVNRSNLYYAKKSFRKILRVTNRYIRYSGRKQTEVELRIHYCRHLKQSGFPLRSGTVLGNMFINEMGKIRKAVSTLHEDLQHDYNREIDGI